MKKLMRTEKCDAKIAILVTLLSAASGHSQAWETILDYKPGPQHAAARDIAISPAGDVIVAATFTDAGGADHGVVLQTDSTEQIWTVSDDTNLSPSQFNSGVK